MFVWAVASKAMWGGGFLTYVQRSARPGPLALLYLVACAKYWGHDCQAQGGCGEMPQCPCLLRFFLFVFFFHTLF